MPENYWFKKIYISYLVLTCVDLKGRRRTFSQRAWAKRQCIRQPRRRVLFPLEWRFLGNGARGWPWEKLLDSSDTQLPKGKSPPFSPQCMDPDTHPELRVNIAGRGRMWTDLKRHLSPNDRSGALLTPRLGPPATLSLFPTTPFSGRHLCLQQFEGSDSLLSTPQKPERKKKWLRLH